MRRDRDDSVLRSPGEEVDKLLADAGVMPAGGEHLEYRKWSGESFHLLIRFDLAGRVTFDPCWRDAEGWNRFFAPMVFEFYPWLVRAVVEYLADPTEFTARRIHSGSYKLTSEET